MQFRDLLAELVLQTPGTPFFKDPLRLDQVALASKRENQSLAVIKWKGDRVYPVVQLRPNKNSLYWRLRQLSIIQVLRVEPYVLSRW